MVDYVLAVDLGQAQDYSAMAVLQRCWWCHGERAMVDTARLWHQIRDIQRWPLGTPYPVIVQQIAERHAVLVNEYAQWGVALVVDQGGPGRPVIDLLKLNRRARTGEIQMLKPIGVTITGGDLPHERTEMDGAVSLTVPKRDICSALVVAAQSGDLKVAEELADAGEFEQQVRRFGYKVNRRTGHVGYEALEEQVHDDIVVAAALGLWYSIERLGKRFPVARTADKADVYDPFAATRDGR